MTLADLEVRGPGARTSRSALEGRSVPKGWHDRGYLPHFDAPDLVQHVIFRLEGSLPAAVVHDIRGGRRPADERRSAIDDELDKGAGPTWLADPWAADTVVQALRHDEGERHRLHAWCLMPNHVHVLAEMLDGVSLGPVVKSWKSFTARMINRRLGRSGRFWAPDYFDRYVRDAEQFARVAAYIENNPVKAGLCRTPADWPWSSASRYADLEVRAPVHAPAPERF